MRRVSTSAAASLEAAVHKAHAIVASSSSVSHDPPRFSSSRSTFFWISPRRTVICAFVILTGSLVPNAPNAPWPKIASYWPSSIGASIRCPVGLHGILLEWQ